MTRQNRPRTAIKPPLPLPVTGRLTVDGCDAVVVGASEATDVVVTTGASDATLVVVVGSVVLGAVVVVAASVVVGASVVVVDDVVVGASVVVVVDDVVVGASVVVVVVDVVVVDDVVVGASVVVVVVDVEVVEVVVADVVPHGTWLIRNWPKPVMSVPAGNVIVADVMVKLPVWFTVLFKKWAVFPPLRSVNVATAVLPSENVMFTGPKSAPLMVAPLGYSNWFMMKCQPLRFGEASHAAPTLENGVLPTGATVPPVTLVAYDVPLIRPSAPPPSVSATPTKHSFRATRR